MTITRTTWNWTDDNGTYLARVLLDHIEWVLQRTGQQRHAQPIRDFLNGVGIPDGFQPPQAILDDLTAFLKSGAWKTIAQWETLWVECVKTEAGRLDVTLTYFRGAQVIRQHPNTDRAFLDYLLYNLKNQGWRELRRDGTRIILQRKWQYREDSED